MEKQLTTIETPLKCCECLRVCVVYPINEEVNPGVNQKYWEENLYICVACYEWEYENSLSFNPDNEGA